MTKLITINFSNKQVTYQLMVDNEIVLSSRVHQDTKVTLESMMVDFLQISELENQKNIQKINDILKQEALDILELETSINQNLKIMKIVSMELGNV